MKRQQVFRCRSYPVLSGMGRFFLALIVFMISSGLVFAQRTVTGTVTGPDNSTLPGVSIIVKGTGIGTITDISGKYSLQVPVDAKTLIFSFVGMESKGIAVGHSNVYNVSLSESLVGVDEVVVIGFGKQSREVVTTSISKLNTAVLKNIPYQNVASALQGNLSGVRVQSISGQPGAPPRIIIRGGTSINNPDGAAPLYIVDGVVRPDINNINADDIKSIQVLKDASSTAIYGARGSNGVVILETKSGATGPTRVTYRYDLSTSEQAKKYDFLNAREFVYYERIGIRNAIRNNPAYSWVPDGNTYVGGIANDLTNKTWDSLQELTEANKYKLDQGWQSMPDPLMPSRTLIFSDTDWQNEMFRTALSQNHSLNISGGSEKVTFNLGLGYLKAQGIATGTDFNRANLNLSSSVKITDDINVFGKVAYSNSVDHMVPKELDYFKNYLLLPPTVKRYFEDGTTAPGQSMNFANPYYLLNDVYVTNNNFNDLTLILGGQWKIIPSLTFEPQFSLYQTNSYARKFTKAYLNGPLTTDATRSASASYSKRFDPQGEAVLTYNKTFNEVHNIEIKAGFSYFSHSDYAISAAGRGAATDLIPTLNASAVPVSVSGSENKQVIIGYFSRVFYNYKSKYLFNASLRYDGASNLGENNKWGSFPGISLGWNIHNENFWKETFPKDLLSKLKIRTSYGVNGNISGLGLYQAQGIYSTGANYFNFGGITNTVVANQNLKWERSKTVDCGIDLGLFNNRANILVDVYRRVTDNLLTNLSLPLSTGFSTILTNYGTLENKGFEIEINYQVLPSTSDFRWDVSFNYADVNTKILKLPDNGIENNRVGGEYMWDPAQGKYAWLGGLQEGGRIGDQFAYNQLGVYATDAEAANAPFDINLYKKWAPSVYYIEGGDTRFQDVDGNDTIDVRDKVYVGNIFPKVSGGFTNSFAYKNLNLDIRMDYTLGHTINYELGARVEGNFSGNNTLGGELRKSWENPGDITDVPKVYFADVHNNIRKPNSRFYPKGDFLCLREVTLSYSLPARIIQKYKITDLRFKVTGQNLHYFTKFPGLNPEANNTDAAYPNPRTITYGVSVTF